MVISEEVVSHTIETKDSQGASGGDIIHVTDLLGQLLSKHIAVSNPTQNCGQSRIITDNIVNTTDYLFNSTIGWNEIPNKISRYESSSSLLDVSDLCGYTYLNRSTYNESLPIDYCHSYHFQGVVITMQSSKINKSMEHASSSICFIFGSTSICVPDSAHSPHKSPAEEILLVAVQYEIDVSANIFPFQTNSLQYFGNHQAFSNQFQNSTEVFALNEFLIGLSINDDMHIETIAEEPIQITFIHKDEEVFLVVLIKCLSINILK